ncbi:MAG: bifunctional adenosylcobinamide kinase/adenosylcobinamide-phosphate guanylyltransferase [Bryobacterales bacterium]|nr:bifunctional adenosylcobinamide kinase/adenosylcobinamide-phosphate guanylyltransferase [Bryobacterales bacterium]
MALVFIAGGSRSGKSRTAWKMAISRGQRPVLIATSEPSIDDYSDLAACANDASEHSPHVIVEPLCLSDVLRRESAHHDLLMIDSVTVWLSNIMQREAPPLAAQVEELTQMLSELPVTVIAVATEVGCGIEPETELARRFRDEAGRLNQRCAALADETYWMVFGCPLRVK